MQGKQNLLQLLQGDLGRSKCCTVGNSASGWAARVWGRGRSPKLPASAQIMDALTDYLRPAITGEIAVISVRHPNLWSA